MKKAKTFFSKQNIYWLGIFLVFLAVLSFVFMMFSSRRTKKIISSHAKPLIVEEIEVADVNEEENLFEALDFQKVHTQFQASYLELVKNISTRQPEKNSDGTIHVNVRKEALTFETYKKAQSNYEKVLKKVEKYEKDYKLKCFARMRKLILAVLYCDKKTGKKVTKFDPEKMVEIGAFEEAPTCPRGGEYSIIYKDGRRLFNCSLHGILKN